MKRALPFLFVLTSFFVQAQDDKAKTVSPTLLWIVDNVVQKPDSTKKDRFLDLNPDDIERISVVKGDSAILHYGEAGRYGVIIITTKNHRRKKSGSHH